MNNFVIYLLEPRKIQLRKISKFFFFGKIFIYFLILLKMLRIMKMNNANFAMPKFTSEFE